MKFRPSCNIYYSLPALLIKQRHQSMRNMYYIPGQVPYNQTDATCAIIEKNNKLERHAESGFVFVSNGFLKDRSLLGIVDFAFKYHVICTLHFD